MRTLPLLLALLLASFVLASEAHALPLPVPAAPSAPFAAADDEAEEEGEEGEAGEAEEAEACEAEAEGEEGEEELEICEEEASEEGDECVIESASAAVVDNPFSGRVRVTVRYRAAAATTALLTYSLHGGKGALHLGSARAQLHASGLFHDVLEVPEHSLPKLDAARQFVVALQAAGTPGYCRESLTVQAPRRSTRPHRAGGRGRSGAPAPTRGS